MSALFEASRIKVLRAKRFISEVESELLKYASNEPLTSAFRVVDGEPKIYLSWKGVDPMTGAAVGDAVHNLRTSLDLMASELARLNGKSDSNVYFPFASSEVALGDQIQSKNFLDCGEDAVNLLRTFSPYKGGNLRLRALHDLDIQDKHTALIPTFATHDFSIEATIEFQLDANIAMPVNVSRVDFTFPPGYPLETVSIVESLKDMVEIVDGILKSFEAMVDARTIER